MTGRLGGRGEVARRVGLAVVLLAALGGGWLWGASGRWEVDRALRAAGLQNDLLEARVSLLGARVSLYEADFGEVIRQLEDARGFIDRLGARLGRRGPDDDPRRPALRDLFTDIAAARRAAELLDADVRAAASR